MKQFEQLAQHANDNIFLVDSNAEIIFANRKASLTYGYSNSEFQKMSMMDLRAVDTGIVIEEVKRKIDESDGIILEALHLKKNGQVFPVEASNRTFTFDGKKLYLAVIRDISERKKSEEQIRFQAHLLDVVMHSVTATDSEGKLIYWNKAAENMFGWTAEEAMGRNATNLLVGCEQIESVKKIIDKVAAGEIWNGECTLQRKDGSLFPVLSTKSPLYDKNNKLTGIVAVCVDISEVKKTQEALQLSETQYKTLFESANDAIVVLDPYTEEIFNINNKACEMYGLTKEELIGMDLKKITVDVDNGEKKIFELLEKGTIKDIETSHYRNDSTIINILYNSSIIDYNGRKAILSIYRDITLKKEQEKIIKNEILERKKAQKEIIINEEKYRNLFGLANDAIIVIDRDTQRIIDANISACTLYDYSKNELIGKNLIDLSVDREVTKIKLKEFFKTGSIRNGKNKHRKRDGTEMDILYNSSLINYNEKTVILAIIRDDTLRRRNEHELLKLSTVVEQSPESIIITGPEGNIEYVNKGFVKLTGYTFEEVEGRNPRLLQSGMTPAAVYQEMWNTIHAGKGWSGEFLNKKKSGDLYWQSVSITPIKDAQLHTTHYVSIQQDNTETKAINEELKNSLIEKETMLKEIHHRVKNNLQIISSLLKLQSEHIEDKKALLIFKESQRRIKAMALIHQNLYANESLSSIDFHDYTRKLVSDIFSSFNILPNLVKYELIIDDIFLDIETSIPCGLIINELVSNSLKYAFNGICDPLIRIEFVKVSESAYRLSVSDNGTGIPQDIEYKTANTLGLKLVNTLTDQLDGTLKLENCSGTKFTIEFHPTSYKKRI